MGSGEEKEATAMWPEPRSHADMDCHSSSRASKIKSLCFSSTKCFRSVSHTKVWCEEFVCVIVIDRNQ